LIAACAGSGQLAGDGLEPPADDPDGMDDTAETEDEDTGDQEEICDGIDNDGDGVIDNGLEFLNYWVDADGDGYGGPTGSNCTDLLEEGFGDGVYEIWPSGREEAPLMVFCDQSTDGGGWARVFHHDVAGGYYVSHEDAYHHNEDAPDADLYSILKHLERLRDADGTFELRINWPDTDIAGRNIWRQESNPTTAPVVGYKAVDINYTSQFWAGLELSTSDATYLDGSVQHPYWFYAIGSHYPHLEGIPAHGPVASRVSLWGVSVQLGESEAAQSIQA
jgi:hypothetical protein